MYNHDGRICRQTFENADSSGVVIDSASSPEGSRENLNRRNEIVGKGVVQVTLYNRSNVSELTCIVI